MPKPMLTNRDLGDETTMKETQPPAPTWPTPVAWSELKEGETYFGVPFNDRLPVALEWNGRQFKVKNQSYYWASYERDSNLQPMIYGDDENGTGKQKAAAAMQILLQEWVRG